MNAPLPGYFAADVDEMQRAIKRVRDQIIAAQLVHWPDSRIMTEQEVYREWLGYDYKDEWASKLAYYSKDDFYNPDKWGSPVEKSQCEFRLYDKVEEEIERNKLQTAKAIAIAFQNPGGVFYECGTKDGKRQWRGYRFGLDGSEYASGFGKY